jgi:predicted TIM-barrel fold metal-dependent hydrolase
MQMAELPLPPIVGDYMSPLRGRIVDVWMQHPTPRLGSEPMFESLRRWVPGTTLSPSTTVPLATTIEAMDAAGVRVGLICAWWGPHGPLIDNDEVAAFIREYPDRLIGVASVDLSRPMAAVRELRRAVRQLGFRALRILPWLWNLPPDDRCYYPLYAECVELDIPFCLWTHGSAEPGRPIPYLDHVALDFPDLRIVAGHIGFPWTSEMISLATKYPNVHIDTSAYKVSRYPNELVQYLRSHGRRKVLFGSNYPAWPAKDCLENFDALNLDDETSSLFLFENAMRVFAIEI